MDTSYNAASGDSQYKFLAESLPGGLMAPVARLAHGPLGAPVQVDQAHPLPVTDPLGATAIGQQAIALALQALLSQTDGMEGSLASILAKLSADPSTATAQAAEIAKLTSIDGKLPALSGSRVPAESDDRVLASLIDESTVGTTYVCEAPAGTATSAAGWRIQRIVVAGNVTRITWAAGGAMTQVADNRAALTYA